MYLRMVGLALALNLIAVPPTLAQSNPAIVTGEGWEAFPGVEYQGGDARFQKKIMGVLILSDSSIAFRECRFYNCEKPKGKEIWVDELVFEIPLRRLTAVDQSTSVRGASVGSKIMWGGFANDRKQEFIGFAHETETSAEAPVFRTRTTQAGAIEAKVRFRLKKLGAPLAVDSSTTKP